MNNWIKATLMVLCPIVVAIVYVLLALVYPTVMKWIGGIFCIVGLFFILVCLVKRLLDMSDGWI